MSNSLNNRIKEFRKKNDYTQAELGEMVGVGKTSISMYESGDRVPPMDIIERLCAAFGVDYNTLMGDRHANRIPVLGYVAAGIPIEQIEEILDYEEIPTSMLRGGSEYFALKIKGHSMEPKISDGDVVIVRRQPDVDTNEIAIVGINGEEATCKKIIKYEGGISIVPLNPAYPPQYFTDEQVRTVPVTILGKVVELRAKF